jgi:hypothetical protein
MSLSNKERSRLEQLEAKVDEYLLAPARGSGTIFTLPARAGRPLTEAVREALRHKYPIHKCFTAAMHLFAEIAELLRKLREPLSPRMSRVEAERWERHTVGSIHNLWRFLAMARVLSDVWEDELISLREMREFRCPLGVYPGAVDAVLALGELALEEIWRVAWEADPPPGPPYALDDLMFERGGELPPFRVDWWYARLEALRRHYHGLPDCWGLEGESTCWDAGIKQEVAALQRRLRSVGATVQQADARNATSNEEANGPLPVMLSAADLARSLGQPVSRVESFLRRFRESHPDCSIQVDSPRKNEPRVLYRTADVWPALQQQLPNWRKRTNG